MRRPENAAPATFVVVAEERSFTKAAARLGMAQPAYSQILRRTEERPGLRLLSHTITSLAATNSWRTPACANATPNSPRVSRTSASLRVHKGEAGIQCPPESRNFVDDLRIVRSLRILFRDPFQRPSSLCVMVVCQRRCRASSRVLQQ